MQRRTLLKELQRSEVSLVFFTIFELLWDLPMLTFTAGLYSLPVPFLTAMNIPSNAQLLWLLSFFAIIFVHLLLWRLISKAFASLFPNSGAAIFATILLLTLSHLNSGLVVQPMEPNSQVFHLHRFSPNRWIAQALLESEYLGRSIVQAASRIHTNNSELLFGCKRKEVLARMIDGVPIYTTSQCSTTRGSQLLHFHGFTKSLTDAGFLTSEFFFACSVLVSWISIAFLLIICAISCSCSSKSR